MERDNPEYLIIGGSAAGMAAAQAIKEKDSKHIVTVLSEEPDMPYFRPLIPYVVTGKKKADGDRTLRKWAIYECRNRDSHRGKS